MTPLDRPVEYYLAQINLDTVAEAILTVEPDTPAMLDHDFDTAKEMVWNGADKWLCRDIYEFALEKTEEAFSFPIPGFSPLRGYIDLQGRVLGKHKNFAPYVGKNVVLDWKTSKNTLGSDWRGYLLDSWQWRIYAAATKADIVIYRGISRTGDMAEIIIVVPPTNETEVLEYATGQLSMRKALVDSKLEVWPRYMPKACGAFGRDCPYKTDCEEYSMPRQALEDREMSYSSLSNFALCPERHRRDVILGHNPGSEESNLGSAVHRGLESLYSQIIKKQKEGTLIL